MLKMVDGTGIIGVDMICPLGVSTPQPPNYDRVELEGAGMLVLPNSLDAPLERLELGGKTEQVQTTGKNLLNSNIYVQGYLASIDTGQKISLNTEVKSFTTTMDINALQGKSISISIRTKGNSGKKYAFTDEEDVIINGKFDAGMADYSEYNNIQVPQNAKKFYFSVTYEVQENTKLQLEYGNKATSYEPYTGGKPSPSPEYPQEIKNSGKWNEEKQKYEIEVVLSGKNLLDITACEDGKIFEGSGNIISADNGLLTDFIPCFPNSQYSRSRTGFTVVAFYDCDKNKIGFEIVGNATFVTPEKCRYFRYSINKVQVDYKKLVACPGDTVMDYEPYYHKPIFLNLTSDRPLTKWDRLVEQGGEIGWLYQSEIDADVRPSRIDLFPYGFNLYKNHENGTHTYNVTNIKKAIGFQTSYCKQFKNKDAAYQSAEMRHYSDQPSMKTQYFNTDIPTREEFIEWMESNPLTMVYKTEETEFIPLPQSEQNAIRALKTYYPTTVITVDGGELDPDIKVTYRKEI